MSILKELIVIFASFYVGYSLGSSKEVDVKNKIDSFLLKFKNIGNNAKLFLQETIKSFENSSSDEMKLNISNSLIYFKNQLSQILDETKNNENYLSLKDSKTKIPIQKSQKKSNLKRNKNIPTKQKNKILNNKKK